MTARFTMLLAAALAGLALVTGCGGGSGDSASGADEGTGSETSTTITTSSLSKAQFTAKANGICSNRAERVLSYEPTGSERGTGGPTFEEEALQKKLVPEFGKVIDEIRALGAPSGDEPQIEAFLAALQEDIEEIDQREPASFEEAEKMLKSSGKLAVAYGLEDCSFG